MGGAHVAVKGGRKDFTAGMRNPKEKAPFGEYAKVAWAEWAARGRQRPAGEEGRCMWTGSTRSDPRRRFKGKKLIFEFQMNWDFTMTFEKFYKEI
jgi:hypothetical protein